MLVHHLNPMIKECLGALFFYDFFKLKQLIYIYFIYKTLVLRHAALEITVIQQSSFSDCSSRQHFLDRLRALMHAA